MNKVAKYRFTMLPCFKDNTVDPVLIKRKDSRCPPDTVTFGNSQNNTLDSLPAIVGMHKDSITILRKPLITCLTTQQMGFILAIACTRCYVPLTPNSMILTLWIRAIIITKVYYFNHPPLSKKLFYYTKRER